MSEGVWCYMGRNPTTQILECVVVDDAKHQKLVRDAVADWMRSGHIIERAPIEWAREHFMTADRWSP